MRVRDVMSAKVKTVTPRETVADAKELFRRFDIDQLVVEQHGTIVGIVGDGDLRGAPEEAEVNEFMIRHVTTIPPDATLRKAAGMMTGHAVGSLPVVDGGKLIGILTTADLLTLLSKGNTHPAPARERQVLARRPLRKRPSMF